MVHPKRKGNWTQKPFFLPDDTKRIRLGKPTIIDEYVPTLEKLPPLVLDMIFQYVQSPDLTRIAWLSRDLYWPAVGRIYKRIVLAEEFESAQEIRWSQIRMINLGTIVPWRKLKWIVGSLERNPSLRSLTQYFNLASPISISEPFLERFVSLMTGVKDMYTDGDSLSFENSSIEPEKISCIASSKPPLSRHLVELRMYVLNDIYDKESVVALAGDLIKSGGHLSLRKLHFTCLTPNYEEKLFGPHEPEVQEPRWITFFDELIAQSETLHLTALGLYGTMDGYEEEGSRKLRKCVDLRNIHTLVLHIHQETAHDIGGTFMEHITRFTPQLDSLAIFPTSAHPTEPYKAICNILQKHIPNQLRELLISYFPDYNREERTLNSCADRVDIQKAILESQKGLVKLKLEDDDWLLHRNMWSRDLTVQLEQFTEDWDRIDSWQEIYPCIFGDLHETPRLPSSSVELLKKHINEFRINMPKDLIYAEAAQKLPCLTHYTIDMVAFDMKKRGIFANNDTILIEENLH